MRFGIFGGAKVGGTDGQVGFAGDSIGLREYIEYVVAAERYGFSNVFMVEHHFTGVNQVSSSLALLTYLAARTKRIRLGTAVIVLPWHNPALLAEQISVLDLLSNGRFDFGIGKGYRPQEFKGFGIPMEEAQERFDETLDFLKTAWTTTERFSFAGKHWAFNDIVIEPRPVQQPHPQIWMGAGSAESIRRAAREGVNLLLDQVGSIELTNQRVKTYRDEKIAMGLAPDSGQVAVTRGLRIVRNEAERLAALEEHSRALERAGALKLGNLSGDEGRRIYCESDAALIGTSDQLIERLSRLQAGGVDAVLFADVQGSPEMLRIFAEEVMPQFADDATAKLETTT